MVFNRLCEPDSKLGVLRWLDTVALPGHPEHSSHDHLLRAMDALMDRAGAVEDAVAAQLRPLLDDEMSVVFYDLTTVRISGTGRVADDVRAHGMSKETGGIARQFVLGVIQTREGLPIAHQVHAGNIGEVGTLLPMIQATVKRYRLKRVILIADRGLLSLDNLAAVESLTSASGEPIEYVLAVPGRRYAEFADRVGDVAFVDGVGETRWQDRRLVLAHDAVRAEEQRQAREAAIAALEAEGDRLATGRTHRTRALRSAGGAPATGAPISSSPSSQRRRACRASSRPTCKPSASVTPSTTLPSVLPKSSTANCCW